METIVLINIFATVTLFFFAVMQHEDLERQEKAIRRLARNQKYFKTDLSDDFEKVIDDILNGKH